MMNFHSWFGEKYREWSNGGKKSANQFSIYLGISQSSVSAWLNQSRNAPTSRAIISKLAAKYGDEIYDVLKIPRPDFVATLYQTFPHMTPDVRERLAAALSEINVRSEGIPEGDPRLDEIIRDALK